MDLVACASAVVVGPSSAVAGDSHHFVVVPSSPVQHSSLMARSRTAADPFVEFDALVT